MVTAWRTPIQVGEELQPWHCLQYNKDPKAKTTLRVGMFSKQGLDVFLVDRGPNGPLGARVISLHRCTWHLLRVDVDGPMVRLC